MGRLRLTINSDLKDVVLVAVTVNRICEHLRMDSVQAGLMEVCAVEAVTNAIRHAYRGEPGHEVSVTLLIDGSKLELDVCDTGIPMPTLEQSRLTEGSQVLEFDTRDLQSVPEGGMGLQIMHELMDEVSYRRQGEVNTLQLIRLLDAVNGESCYDGTSRSSESTGRVLQT